MKIPLFLLAVFIPLSVFASNMVCITTQVDSLHCTIPLTKNTPTRYTLKTIKKHASADSCRSTINSMVYDLTERLPRRPDQETITKGLCGKDATFYAINKFGSSNKLVESMSDYKIGVLRK